MIPIAEYAEIHVASRYSAIQKCKRGGFTSAKKMGRNWYIDEDEPYLDLRFPLDPPREKVRELEDDPFEDMITLKKWCELRGKLYKTQQQKAIRGGFKSARKIGNQWFINADE